MSESSLKQKTIGALLWNLLDRMGQQVLLFIVGILVANILSVEDYALVGMLAIFSAIANIIQDSGFSAALIQKKETTAEEFSSVFWFNLGMSILLYGVLMGCSPLIARFFNQPRLVELSAVIFSGTSHQCAHYHTKHHTEQANPFQTVDANKPILHDGFGHSLACHGTDRLWSMDIGPATGNTGSSARHPAMEPRELASATDFPLRGHTVTVRIRFKPVIGKPHQYLLPEYLFRYHRQTVSAKTTGILYARKQNVRYGCQPDLRKYTECYLPHIQYHPERTERLIRAYRKTIRFTAFITLPIMAGLFVTAGPVIRLLLKEEWWPSIPFFQLLCLGGCFTILTAINNNFIKVSGRSDGILKIEYYKIAFTVAVVLLTYREDVLTMVAGLVVTRLLVYIINMIYTAHYTGYRFSMQLMDLLPYAGLSTLMTLLLLPIGGWIENQLLLLVTQAAAGTVIYIGTAYITGSKILKDSLELIRKKKGHEQ